MKVVISKEQMEQIVAEYFDKFGGIFHGHKPISMTPNMTDARQWDGQSFTIIFDEEKSDGKE